MGVNHGGGVARLLRGQFVVGVRGKVILAGRMAQTVGIALHFLLFAILPRIQPFLVSGLCQKHQKPQFLEAIMVRLAGLEPARVAPLPPQSSVSANSTISATAA